jgi:hypothetical protein
MLPSFTIDTIKVWLAPRPPRPVAYSALGLLVVSEPVSEALDELIRMEGPRHTKVAVLPFAAFLVALAGLDCPEALAQAADRSPLTVLDNVPERLSAPVQQFLRALGDVEADYVALLSLEHLASMSFHPSAQEAAALIRQNAEEILRIGRKSEDTLFGPRFLKRPRLFKL